MCEKKIRIVIFICFSLYKSLNYFLFISLHRFDKHLRKLYCYFFKIIFVHLCKNLNIQKSIEWRKLYNISSIRFIKWFDFVQRSSNISLKKSCLLYLYILFSYSSMHFFIVRIIVIFTLFQRSPLNKFHNNISICISIFVSLYSWLSILKNLRNTLYTRGNCSSSYPGNLVWLWHEPQSGSS